MSDHSPRSATPTVAERVLGGAAELLSGVATVCVGAALLWTRHEAIVWQPPRWGGPDPQAPPAGVRRLDYRAGDGQPLFAWVEEPSSGPSRGTVLAFHGNAELAAWSVPWAREVAARTGWRVVLPEYRGYAGLGGTSSHAASRLDAWAAWVAVRDACGGDVPLALVGHSLGSAVAAELAVSLQGAAVSVGALVLQAPFTSIADMTRLFAGRRAHRWARVGRVHFDTVARVAALEVPVWVAHGACDLIVPQRMGRLVHAAARRPGGWLGLGLAGHNDVPRAGGARYWRWLGDALAESVVTLPTPACAGDRATDGEERVVRSDAL